MSFMNQADHQALLDTLRGELTETERTDIIVQLTNNYNEVVSTDADVRKLLDETTAQNKRYQAQNNELFLAATAHARTRDNDNDKQVTKALGYDGDGDGDEDDTPAEFLGGMFDKRGNLINN